MLFNPNISPATVTALLRNTAKILYSNTAKKTALRAVCGER